MKVKWYDTGLNAAIRERGMLYYRHNQVHVQSVDVTELSELHFTAEVEGTDRYSRIGHGFRPVRKEPFSFRRNPIIHCVLYARPPGRVQYGITAR